jgi:hypothetical protein
MSKKPGGHVSTFHIAHRLFGSDRFEKRLKVDRNLQRMFRPDLGPYPSAECADAHFLDGPGPTDCALGPAFLAFAPFLERLS